MKIIPEILESEFGIAEAEVKVLYGYDNVNYDIRAGDGHFILKQYKDEPGLKELITSENNVLRLLSNRFPGHFQQPINTKEGSDWAR